MGEFIFIALLFFICLGALVHFFNHTELGKGLRAISGPFIWVIGVILGAILGLFGWTPKPKRGRHDSARFMSWWEQSGFISKKLDGICIQGTKFISLKDSTRHTLIAAGTGSGKTMTNIIPTILNLNGASVVITDPSKEIRKYCLPYLYSIGYDVRVLDVEDLSNTHTYNPLARIKDDQDILNICEILVNTNTNQNSSTNKFWEQSSKNLLYILIKCLLYEPKEYHNLGNLRRLITNFGQTGEGLDNFFKRTAVYSESLFNEIISFRKNSPDVLQNILASCRAYLSDYISTTITKITESDSIAFEDMREKPVAIFLNISEEKQSVYAGLMAMLFSQMMDFANVMPKEGKPYMPIMFLLEEMINGISVIPKLSERLSVLRKRDTSIVIVLQSLASLHVKYGQDAKNIIAQCSSRIIYGGLPIEDCEFFSRTFGKYDHTYTEMAEETTQDTQRQVVIARSLLTPGEIRSLEGILYLFAHKPPVLFNRKTPWYENRTLTGKTQTPDPNLHYGTANEIKYLDLESEESSELENELIDHFNNGQTQTTDGIEPGEYSVENEPISF